MLNGNGQSKDGLPEGYVRMFYEHQFERMGRLEDQRLMISNIVITISILAFSFGFGKLNELTVINGLGLPALMVFSNMFAIAYITRASRWVGVHRRRAKHLLEKYAPELQEINRSSRWISSGPFGSRTNIQRLLHIVMLITAFVPVFAYFKVIP